MKKAFTLIELLIVVAIIAILAAIAVPNFLEAQTRSKVSRSKADIRSLSTALEAYCVDENAYPLCSTSLLGGALLNDPAGTRILERLSTPVAYVTTALLKDPFTPTGKYSGFSPGNHQGTFQDKTADADVARYLEFKYGSISSYAGPSFGFADNSPAEKAIAWILFSSGPDRGMVALGTVMPSTDEPMVSAQFYDPTNGTVSYGDIFRVGGNAYPATGGWGGTFFTLTKARN